MKLIRNFKTTYKKYMRLIINIFDRLLFTMNKDIFIMDYDNEQQVAADIENEEYDMSMLPEDDDFGDEDGDEYY